MSAPDGNLDHLRPDALERLAATLDGPAPDGTVPVLWHWTSFLDRTPTSLLGPDGHPRAGGIVEDPPFPHRMFAGARLVLHRPLPVEEPIERRVALGEVVRKQGASGPLAFLTVTLTYTAAGSTLAEEEQDLVYRPEPAARGSGGRREGDAPDPRPPGDAREPDWTDTRTFTPVHLFRFSALTFNSHRIHYDPAYTTDVEDHPALVVQGPLLAVCLAEVLRTRLGDAAVAEFGFRGRAPAFAGEQIEFAAWRADDPHEVTLAARRDGVELMSASARLRPEHTEPT